MRAKNVLIIGGNGFIGINLAKILTEKGSRVTSFDLVRPSCELPGVDYIAGDFFDTQVLEEILKDKDAVVHAISTINPSNSNEKYMRGYEGDFLQSVRLCEMAVRYGVKLLFLSSGGTVYGNQEHQPITELASTHPINHYAALKLCIENVMRTFHAQQNADMVIARISNPYGPGQDYHRGVGFIDAALKKSLTGEVMEIWGDGETVRDYVAIEDVCQMLCALLEYEGPEDVFNISSGQGESQNDILRYLQELGIDLKVAFKPSRNVDLKKTVLDNSRIRQIYTKPLKSFKEGILEYYTWLKEQKRQNEK